MADCVHLVLVVGTAQRKRLDPSEQAMRKEARRAPPEGLVVSFSCFLLPCRRRDTYRGRSGPVDAEVAVP